MPRQRAIFAAPVFRKGMANCRVCCLAVLQFHHNQDREAWPSLDTIKDKTGFSKSQCSRVLAELTARGAIESRDRSNQRHYRYRLAAEHAAWTPKNPSNSADRCINATEGEARNQPTHSETPVPDAARASARRKGEEEQQGEEASQPAPGGLSEPQDGDQGNRPASNANNSGSSAKASTSSAGELRPQPGPSPAEVERRARQRAEAARIARNTRRNMLLTMNRWVRFNLAGDELLAALELLARCELAVHDWGGRSGADILAFDALRGRERRNRLPKEVATASWRAEHGQEPNHGLEAAKARGWGTSGRAGAAIGGIDDDWLTKSRYRGREGWDEKSPYRGRAAA